MYQMTSRSKALRSKWLALPILAAIPAAALGQQIEEIVVTAQRRAQSSQDVGIAITALSGEDLRSVNIESSAEVAQFVPGVHVAGAIAGQFTTFSIRGVTQNDFLDHTEAPNAVYLDEAYIASMQGQSFALFDLERVEALKGPQGTLFGRNATGGLVHFVTRKPTDEVTANFNTSFGRFNQVRVEGGLGGPIAEGVGARAAVLFSRHDPVFRNTVVGAGDEWTDDTLAGRLHLDAQLGNNASYLLTLHGGRSRLSTAPYKSRQTIAEVDDQGRVINSFVVAPNETRECIGPGGINADCGNDLTGEPDGFLLTRPVPGGDFNGFRDDNPGGLTISKDFADPNINRVHTYGATGRLLWGIGGVDLAWISDYRRLEKSFFLDADATPTRQFNTFQKADIESISQELRVSGRSNALRWVAGLYYLNIDANIPGTGFLLPVDAETPTIVALGLGGLDFVDQYRLKTNSYSAFAQTEIELSRTVTLVTGLRVTIEEKDFDYRSDIQMNGEAISPIRDFADSLSNTLISARAQLEYRPIENIFIYGGYNRGVKAGSFNAPFGGAAVIADADIPYRPEILNSYEVGVKSDFWNRRARFNLSVFYYDYKDYQAFKLIGLATQVVNADATYYGGEAEFQLRPSQYTSLNIGASYLSTKVRQVEFFGNTADREAAFAPNVQLNGILRQEFPISRGRFFTQAEGLYTSSFFYSLSNFDSTKVPDYFIGNARLGYRFPDNRWEVTAFVENITNTRNITFGFDLSTACGCSQTSYGRPRWWGLSINFQVN